VAPRARGASAWWCSTTGPSAAARPGRPRPTSRPSSASATSRSSGCTAQTGPAPSPPRTGRPSTSSSRRASASTSRAISSGCPGTSCSAADRPARPPPPRVRDALVRAHIPVEAVDDLFEGGFHFGPALRVPAQARFHPLKYLRGLAAAVRRHGGVIDDDAHAVSVHARGWADAVSVDARVGPHPRPRTTWSWPPTAPSTPRSPTTRRSRPTGATWWRFARPPGPSARSCGTPRPPTTSCARRPTRRALGDLPPGRRRGPQDGSGDRLRGPLPGAGSVGASSASRASARSRGAGRGR
jgi:hypothetical protein